MNNIFTPIINNSLLNKKDKSLNLGFNISDIYLAEYDEEGELTSESVDLKKYRITYFDEFPSRERKFYVLESYVLMQSEDFLKKLKIYN